MDHCYNMTRIRNKFFSVFIFNFRLDHAALTFLIYLFLSYYYFNKDERMGYFHIHQT